MKFAIYTLGCKVNHCESAAISEAFQRNGYIRCDDSEKADIYVINSCTVTSMGDKKSRQAAGRFRALNPNAVIALVGCYPQAFPEKVKALSCFDVVTGTADKEKIVEIVTHYLHGRSKIFAVRDIPREFEPIGISEENDRTRAFIKIEDGCDRFCSYCIIPAARGRVRSRPLDEIQKDVRFQVTNGHKEIVLVGVNLYCYGKELGLRLVDAIERVCEVDGVERVRIGSLEPEMVTDEDIARMKALPKFCPHFHLSLQSGCDETLERMNRKYDTAYYRELVGKLRKAFPSCSITTDIMVGFCGETDEEFTQSLKFCDEIHFAEMHVFSYSIREGTVAACRTDHIAPHIKSARAKAMGELAASMNEEWLENQVGTTQSVLIEKRTSPEYINGVTPNYTPVRVYGGNAERYSLVDVKITGFENGYCTGEII